MNAREKILKRIADTKADLRYYVYVEPTECSADDAKPMRRRK